jgi:hypothetical protein
MDSSCKRWDQVAVAKVEGAQGGKLDGGWEDKIRFSTAKEDRAGSVDC